MFSVGRKVIVMSEKADRPVFLSGERLSLRPLEESDLERCRRWLNNPEARRFLKRRYPLDAVEEAEWFRSRDRSSDILLAIVLKDGERHIGNIGLHRIDWPHRCAQTGMIIGEADCRGQGLGHEAKELLLGYAFTDLGLHRVGSSVIDGNTPSIRCLLKSGYREEGRRRKRWWHEGRFVDEVEFGLLAEEWFLRPASET